MLNPRFPTYEEMEPRLQKLEAVLTAARAVVRHVLNQPGSLHPAGFGELLTAVKNLEPDPIERTVPVDQVREPDSFQYPTIPRPVITPEIQAQLDKLESERKAWRSAEATLLEGILSELKGITGILEKGVYK